MKTRHFAFFFTFFLTFILLAIFYAPVLFFGREFFTSDHSFYFEPFSKFIASSYQRGRLPLWNPYCYCGMPQLANPSPGIFYLPSFLFVFFPYSVALGLILSLHQLVAFVGAFLLIESLGWGAFAAAFCGVVMSFNGYMTSLSSNYTLPGSAAWGILAVYAVVNIGRPRWSRPAARLGYVVLGAFAVHCMLMAGRPEVFVPMAVLHVAIAGCMLFGWIAPFAGPDIKATRSARLNVFAWQISAIAIGVLLSSPMILPVYEWSKLSPRASGIKLDNVLKWSSNWYDLLCMICPQPLGDLQQPSSKYLTLVATHAHHYPFLPSALIGPVALTLAWLGLFDKTFRSRFYVLAGLAVALFLAMGRYGPLSSMVLKALPSLSVLRYPCKLLIVVVFFLAIFGSRGINQVARRSIGPKQKIFLHVFWLALLAVSAFMTLGKTYCAAHLTKFPADFVYKIGFSLVVTSTIGIVIALLISFADKLKLAPRYLAFTLVLLTLVSIFVPDMKNAPKTVAAGFFARPQALNERLMQYLPPGQKELDGRICPLYFDPLKVASGYEPRYPVQLGETFMQYARELLLPNTGIDCRMRETFGYESSENKDFRDVFIKILHMSSTDVDDATDLELARWCAITGTKFVSTQVSNDKGAVNVLAQTHFNLVHEDVALNYRLYAVFHTTPRVYFANAYRTVANQDEVIKAIFAPTLKGVGVNASEFDQHALIELDHKTNTASDWLNFTDRSDSKANAILNGTQVAKPNFSKDAVFSIAAGGAAAKTAILLDDDAHVSVSVNTPADGFVILNDRFYPGWHAVVDTQPTEMYRANAFMRAVYVSKGQHLIEFNYEPESLRNGFYIALVASFALLVILITYLRQPAADLLKYLSTGKSAKVEQQVESSKT